MKQSFYEIFSELNRIPRPSHHEGPAADFLCQFAQKLGLNYRRDNHNCVVIEKPASPGCENAAPVVILNHMDMVCVAQDGYLRDGRPFDPLNDEIRPYIETDENGVRWMKAEGTSLGADNGVGLAMALAILADDDIKHPALEVLTTTNEEDGMSGAEGLSLDFIKGRKIVNLDSEAYDEITVGAAGAYLQVAHWTPEWKPVPAGWQMRRLVIDGGLGGHSGVEINKGRFNCNQLMAQFFATKNWPCENENIVLCAINGGTANAAIPSHCHAIVAVNNLDALAQAVEKWDAVIKAKYGVNDPKVSMRIEDAEPCENYIGNAAQLLSCLASLPCNMLAMRDDMPGTVMTSNNMGVISTQPTDISASCHTRSFSNEEMRRLARNIADTCTAHGAARVDTLMDTGSWMEDPNSQLIELTCQCFKDVLGFEPRKMAMHFVLESAYYVEKYPGCEIVSMGPLIIEPHSTCERINLDTADNIWAVTKELITRLAQA